MLSPFPLPVRPGVRCRRGPTSLLVLAGLVLVPAAGLADVVVTPMVGQRFGATDFPLAVACPAVVGAPCPDLARGDDGGSLGLVVGFDRGDRWRIELLVNRQTSDLEITAPPCEECQVIDFADGELEIVTVHLGAQRRWPGGRVEPFVAFAAGVSSLSSDGAASALLDVDEERASASLAAGLEVPLSPLLGLRFEARGYWIDLPADLAVDDALTQGEVAAGLSFRF